MIAGYYGSAGVNTAVGFGPQATHRYTTTYFRKSFSYVTKGRAYVTAGGGYMGGGGVCAPRDPLFSRNNPLSGSARACCGCRFFGVVNAVVADGAVFYLNGKEFARVNMPTGPVTATTLALSRVSAPTPTTLLIPTGLVVAGTNVLSVEVRLLVRVCNMCHVYYPRPLRPFLAHLASHGGACRSCS